jgi:hypothetical protein
MVSPIYVIITNPLSRLEVIMQTSRIDQKSISTVGAMKEVLADAKTFGLRGIFRGQGLGIVKVASHPKLLIIPTLLNRSTSLTLRG